MIPMNIKIYVQDQDKKPFRLWLPLWLIFPVLIILGLLLLPILIFVVLIIIFFKGLSFFINVCAALVAMFIAFKGTRIEISGKSNVYIEID
ncbi:MAG: hypothetical protein Fur0010_21780 [Bdellovibrio sp.]